MSVKARVVVTLDIDVDGTWGDDCTVAQVKKQAIDNANHMLTKNLTSSNDIKIVGKLSCVNIIYTE